MSYLEEYRKSVYSNAHAVTGSFMSQGKIKKYEVAKSPDGIIYTVYFADDGKYLEVEIKELNE